jgi:D-serine deaminase-like pyridoxal phosphate-dependent protein
LASKLSPESINILVDNLEVFLAFHNAATTNYYPPLTIGIFVKVDTGYHRAGITTTSPNFPALVSAIISKSKNSGPFLKGFYSHYGHSYAGSSPDDAAEGLLAELVELEKAVSAVSEEYSRKLVLSVGATPTTTAAQNMLSSSGPRAQEFTKLLGRLKERHDVELHAGVYPLLDCQQVATHARPAEGPSHNAFEPLSKDAIAIKVLVEVTSIYTEREKPEALISAGSLALGREPCKSYPGWGIVTPDLGNSNTASIYDERGSKTGWIVGRISQEHGILTWEGDVDECKTLTIGDKITVWPNHACVAGAGFGWYCVVDGDEEEVADVWVRWRGW